MLSEFAYNILARLTRPLLSSQRRCCAATLSAALDDGDVDGDDGDGGDGEVNVQDD